MAELYLIGNAHIDPAWMWRWQDGYSEVLATFKSALDRLRDFPELKFTAGSAVYYQWIEKTDPKMFSEIKKRVAEGRWNIVGGWFLQPDCNIPDGESYARHSLIAQRYFKEKFGITAKTGYNVDPFGHNGSLPMILRESGMENYVCMRPAPHQTGFPDSLFYWESADGSKVRVFRVPITYHIDLSCMENFGQIKQKAEEEGKDYMAFFGVGNHGGGPTIKLIDEINKLDIDGMRYSAVDEYFADIDYKNAPVIHKELHHDLRGCYSALTAIKAQNRKAENNLIAAETVSVMALKLLGEKYPGKKLNKAWKNLLFNQFHDILGGCSIKQVYDDAAYLYGEAMSITEQAINFAMQKIAWNIDTLNGETLPSYKSDDKSHGRWNLWTHEVLGTPVVVFNTHTRPVRQVVRARGAAIKMTDCDGNEIPFQIVRGRHSNFGDGKDTVFTAEVPPLGYACYRLFTEHESTQKFENSISVTETVLENSKIRVELSEKTGDICSFYDKESGKYIIDKPCKAVILDETDCTTWAHDKDELGQTVGEFKDSGFKIIEQGTVRASVCVTSVCGNSVLQRTYTIFSDSDRLEVKVRVDFREKYRSLKFAFPLAEKRVIAKIPYGTAVREGYTGEEPCGSWFASGGMCVLNDSKYAYDTSDDYVKLTVLRTTLYADHFCERDEFCEHMDMGVHEFSYAVLPYKSNGDSQRAADEFNSRLRTVMGSFHGGSLPLKMGCFECENDNITVTAIKKSEDNENAVIRFYETDGKDTNVSIKLFGKTISTNISHNSLKTFDENGKELNFIEWEKQD